MNINKLASLLILLAATQVHAANPQMLADDSRTEVTLENPGKSVAFAVRLKLTKGAGGPEILPVIWQDNCISLLPGERREIAAAYRTTELGTAKPQVEVSGWNLQ